MPDANIKYKRLLSLSKDHHFFLFGARNTGKSTLLSDIFSSKHAYWIDLLKSKEEQRFSRDPDLLRALVGGLDEKIRYIIIDEVQKIPKLLDIVHSLIECTNKIFILTGSSARKLKYSGANLLAGRAFVFSLFPLSVFELGNDFNLEKVLRFGSLPAIFHCNSDQQRKLFLQAYTETYLKEEIWLEQHVKKLEPFRRFLEVAAQCNGKIINQHNIAKDVGVDDKTINNYFSLLEDTLIGFRLDAFHHSFRKRLNTKPKFYLLDTGIVRALRRELSLELRPSTFSYGDAFEHFIILEFIKLNAYFNKEYRFSHLRTKEDVEVDLIVDRPGLPYLFVEIKSSRDVQKQDLSSFIKITKDFPNCEAICLSCDEEVKQFDHVRVIPWKQGLASCFNIT